MIHESPNFLAQLTGCFAKPVAENPTVAMGKPPTTITG